MLTGNLSKAIVGTVNRVIIEIDRHVTAVYAVVEVFELYNSTASVGIE
jgi:hypothetical protein